MTVLFQYKISARVAEDSLSALNTAIEDMRAQHPFFILGNIQATAIKAGGIWHVEITRLPGPGEDEKP